MPANTADKGTKPAAATKPKAKAGGAKPAAAKAGDAKPVAPKAYGERHADQKKEQKPGSPPAGVTAGPSQDDRGFQMPKKVLEGDFATRMIAYVIEGGSTVVTLAAGLGQGLHEGMSLELLSPKGKSLADIEVYNVRDRTSKATVRMIPDMLREHDGFIIRPR